MRPYAWLDAELVRLQENTEIEPESSDALARATAVLFEDLRLFSASSKVEPKAFVRLKENIATTKKHAPKGQMANGFAHNIIEIAERLLASR